MDEKLVKCMIYYGEDVSTPISYPETKKWFELREYTKLLIEKKIQLFHLLVEKILFIMKRSTPDLETAVSFLMNRVSKNNVDNWKVL